jgi:hypothetical protein
MRTIYGCAVVAFDDDQIGRRMGQPALDIFLIFRRTIAGERGSVINKFDNDVARPLPSMPSNVPPRTT